MFTDLTIRRMQHESYSRLFERAAVVTRGSIRPVTNEADLAWHLNMSQQRLNGWQSRGVSKQGALEAEKLLGIPAVFILDGQGSPDVAATPGEDHGVSQSSLMMAGQDSYPTVTWGAMRHEALPGVFLLTVPDNAMADRVLKGHIARFNKHLDPRAEDGVLVEDRAGKWHIRIYSPGAEGRFSALAKNPAYQPLESERDGLTVLAVLVGLPEARWG